MEYKKPICDCGEPLFYWDEEITAKEFIKSINDNGKILLTRKMINKTIDCGADPRLICMSCKKEFEYDWDNEKRIVKGEILQ